MDEDLIEMMECLNNYVGEEIVYDTWFYGNRVIGKGILKNVKPYSGIETDKMYISFIAIGGAIKCIKLANTDQIIYYNPYIEDNYDRRDVQDVAYALSQSYGINYK